MSMPAIRVPAMIFALVGSFAVFPIALRPQASNSQSTPAQPPPYHSVWDGIYTEEQAERGRTLYRQRCGSCHGDTLTGKESDSTPALAGPEFETEWSGRTVNDLFKKILRKMPQDDPGTLTPPQSVDLAAFLLSFNKFPAGKNELPPEGETLASIRFDAKTTDPKKTSSQAQ
jgi:quinoprotein glucose dehydrogenase